MAVRLIAGDALTELRKIPTDSVDLVMCSPPYEDARSYGIDFSLRGQEWVDWAVPIYLECARVCRGLVAWVVEGKTKKFRWSATPALMMADLHRAGVRLRKPPIFHRVGISGSGGPDWWRNDYEFIVCSSKGKLPWSDNTANGHPPKWAPGGDMSHRLSDGTRRNQWGHSGKGKSGARNRDGSFQESHRPSHVEVTVSDPTYVPPKLANAGNVIHCLVGGGVMGSRLCHENEAPYPEKLVEPFVRCYCPPAGVVLDPFAGSGTTIAVARQLGRHAIGIDCRPSQVELTKRRLKEPANPKSSKKKSRTKRQKSQRSASIQATSES